MKTWTLMMRQKPLQRFILQEGKSVTIGRIAEADVVMDNPSISRLHAEVGLENGQTWIIDKGSTNGTWVNGEKITERTPISEKDEIKVGKFDLVAGEEGVMDVEKQSHPVTMGADPRTMFVPPGKK